MAPRNNKPKSDETTTPTDRDYVANWRVDNIQGEVLEAGETITLEPKAAQPYIESGVLSEVEAAPVVEAGDEDPAA